MSDFATFEARLKVIMAETGELHSGIIGVEIKVLDPIIFPWAKILMALFEVPLEVWVTKENDSLIIKTEPVVA